MISEPATSSDTIDATVDGHIDPPAANSLRSWRLELPYVKPPLSLNDRRPRMVIWRDQHNLRNQVRYLARAAKIPRLDRIDVALHYEPTDRRTRDQDNLVATLKPAIDGLRDYGPRYRDARMVEAAWVGIVADDSPEHVTWPRPIIHAARPRGAGERQHGRLWLVITEGAPS